MVVIPEKGFSLLEYLMVSFISVILLMGLMQFYLYFWEQNRYQQALLLSQEDTQAAAQVFYAYIRGAGYFYCASNVVSLHSPYLASQAVIGYAAQGEGWQPMLPESISGRARPGSDVIRLGQMRFGHSDLLENIVDQQTFAVRGRFFKSGEVAIIADCLGAEKLTIAAVRTQAGDQQVTVENRLSRHYAQGSAIGHWQQTTLYVRDTGRQDERGAPIYGLYQCQNGYTEELISGIDQLKIRYGLYVNGALVFLSADAIKDFTQVAWVKIIIKTSLRSSNEQTQHTHVLVIIHLRQNFTYT